MAEEIVAHLGLAPPPEGGWHRQTRVGEAPPGERSHWHRVDAAEIWHFQAGAPLVLSLAPAAGPAEERLLGPDLAAGEMPRLGVPEGWWQAARSTGAWTLAGCTAFPGFRFEGFELAPPGLHIPRQA